MKRYVLLSLICALTAVSASAQSKGNIHPVQIPVSRIAPVSPDTFSYAIGVVQAASLRQYLMQQEGVDSAYLSFAAQGIVTSFTAEEEKQIIALAAGLKIARVNRERIVPSLNQQAVGREDSTYVVPEIYSQALAQALMDQPTIFSADSAEKIVNRQME